AELPFDWNGAVEGERHVLGQWWREPIEEVLHVLCHAAGAAEEIAVAAVNGLDRVWAGGQACGGDAGAAVCQADRRAEVDAVDEELHRAGRRIAVLHPHIGREGYGLAKQRRIDGRGDSRGRGILA